MLAGNALAVHDIEFALSGTSLGIDLIAGAAVEQGHRNHMAAINTINRAGGIRQAVESGVLKSGRDVRVRASTAWTTCSPAASGTTVRCRRRVMDLVEAQERYAAALSQNVQLVLMLSSMLHSIGVGNMLPSWVRVVCVDINPAVVTKLSDRGSAQTVGRRHRRRPVPAPARRTTAAVNHATRRTFRDRSVEPPATLRTTRTLERAELPE